MMDPERLRTRLMIAAQKFATEIADAVIEATREDEAPKLAKRRGLRSAPVMPASTDPAATAKAEAALAKLGIRR